MKLEEIVNNRGETEQTAIDQAKQTIEERMNYDLITLENAALKEQLVKFAADLMKFQTLVNDTMYQTEQKNSAFCNEMRRSLQEKMNQLESSNQVINKTIQTEIEKYTGEMDNLVRNHIEKDEDVLNKINYINQKYVDKVSKDIEVAQVSTRRYWFQKQ